jgi:hypothetical protein
MGRKDKNLPLDTETSAVDATPAVDAEVDATPAVDAEVDASPTVADETPKAKGKRGRKPRPSYGYLVVLAHYDDESEAYSHTVTIADSYESAIEVAKEAVASGERDVSIAKLLGKVQVKVTFG